MINADKLGKLDARYRPGTRRDNEFAAEEAKLLDELLAAADLSSPTTPDVRSDDETGDAETAEGEVTWRAPAPAPDPAEEQAVTVWPSQYAEASPAPTTADTTTTIGTEPGQQVELRDPWALGGSGFATQGSPRDVAASVDLGAPSSPEVPVSDETDVADPAQFQVAWQAPVPAGEQPVEQPVAVWPSRYAEASSAPTLADTTPTTEGDKAPEHDKPRQAWSLDAEPPTEEPATVGELTASAGVSSAAAPAQVADGEEAGADVPQVPSTWPSAAPEASEDRAEPMWPSAYAVTTPAIPTVVDATKLDEGEPGQVDQPHRAWSLDDAEPSIVEPEIVAALAAFGDLSVPTTPELMEDLESGGDESPQPVATSTATAAGSDQEVEQDGAAQPAATVWPSPFVTRTAFPSLADPTAASDAAEPVQVEELHQAQSSQDTRFAAGEPEPADAPAASAEVVSPVAPEGSTPDQTGDAETPAVAVTPQEAVASSEQPEGETVTPVPAPYSAETAVAPVVSGTTTPAVDEPREFEARFRPWTLRSAKLAAEEPKLFDAPAASAEVVSPVAPEGSTPDQTGDAETPAVAVQEAVASSEQPDGEAVTPAPAPYSAETAVAPVASGTPAVDEPREFEARFRPWTLRSAKLAAEEPKLFDPPAASAEVVSPVAPEGSTPDQTGDAETPAVAVAPQEAVASSEQPEGEAVTPAPAPYSAEAAVAPVVSGTTTPGADHAREFEARYRPWTLRSAKLAAEEPKLFDAPAASAEVVSPATPEVASRGETDDAEASQAAVTSQAPLSAPEQPEQQQAPSETSPFATQPSPSPTLTPTSTRGDVPHDLDGRYRVWALRAAKLADEEIQPVEKGLTSGGPASETPEVPSRVETNTAETSQPEMTSPASMPALQPPKDRPATSWPSAFATRASASPTVPVAAASAQEPVDLDARYRAWILRAAGEPKPAERPAAPADLPAPAAPKVPSPLGTSTTEASQGEVIAQAPVSAPEQPREHATQVSPSAPATPKPAGPSFTGTTVNRANKPAKPEAPIRAWNFRDIASAVEQTGPIDEPHDSGESDVTVTAADDASDIAAPPLEVSSQAAPSAPQQSHEDAALSPSAESAPEPPGGTVTDAATSIAHTPGKLDARYRPWTMSAGELAAEEERTGKEPAGDDHLSLSAKIDVRSAEQASQAGAAVSPSSYDAPRSQGSALSSTTTVPVGTKPRRGRVSPTVVAIMAVVFLLAALGIGFVALNQKSTTGQWHSRYQSQVAANSALQARTAVLSKDLTSARAAITSLNSNTSALNGQIKSLQIQLSSTSSAQQKAFTKTPLFGQISTEAVTAANEASVCAGEMGSLQTEINDDIANPTHKDPLLQGNTRTANLVCTVARQDNQQLQATLHSAR